MRNAQPVRVRAAGAGRIKRRSRVRSIRARGSREPNPFDSLGEAYLVMGDPTGRSNRIHERSRSTPHLPAHISDARGVSRAWAAMTKRSWRRRRRRCWPVGRPSERWCSRVLAGIARPIRPSAGRRETEISLNARRTGKHVSRLIASGDRARDIRARAPGQWSAERLFASLPEKKGRVGLVLVHLMSGIAQARAGHIDQARCISRCRDGFQRRRRTRELVAQRAGRRNRVGRRRPRDGGVRFFRWASPRKGCGSAPWDANLAILANNLMSRDGLARVARREGTHPRDSDLSPTVVLRARPEMGVGIRAAVCARRSRGCSSSRETGQPH